MKQIRSVIGLVRFIATDIQIDKQHTFGCAVFIYIIDTHKTNLHLFFAEQHLQQKTFYPATLNPHSEFRIPNFRPTPYRENGLKTAPTPRYSVYWIYAHKHTRVSIQKVKAFGKKVQKKL